MLTAKMANLNNFVAKIQKPHEPGSNFAQLLAQKKNKKPKVLDMPQITQESDGVKKIFTNMISNHEASAKAMSSSLVRKDYTPEKLLNSQFNISMFLLREQMYAKTAELSANTLKNFTQMQV